MPNWYEYPTNYSNGLSVDGAADMFMGYPNYILDGKFGMGIITLIFVMTFAISMSMGSKKALAVAGWITFIFSVFLVQLGILNMVVSIVLLIISILGAMGSTKSGGY